MIGSDGGLDESPPPVQPRHATTSIRVFGLLCRVQKPLTQAEVRAALGLGHAAVRYGLHHLVEMELVRSTGRVYDQGLKKWTARYQPEEGSIETRRSNHEVSLERTAG